MRFKKYINEAKGPIEPIFDVNDAAAFVHELEKGIKAPFVKGQYSTLGGPENVSILLMLSLDPKESWENGIAENSRMMRFHIYRNGVVEQFQKSHTISKKFRKATVKDKKSVMNKINTYISQAK